MEVTLYTFKNETYPDLRDRKNRIPGHWLYYYRNEKGWFARIQATRNGKAYGALRKSAGPFETSKEAKAYLDHRYYYAIEKAYRSPSFRRIEIG